MTNKLIKVWKGDAALRIVVRVLAISYTLIILYNMLV